MKPIADRSNRTFKWDSLGETTWGRYLYRREHEFIERFLDVTTSSYRLLDVACGSGRWTVLLRDLGFEVIGLDTSWAALAALRRKSETISIIRGSAGCLPFGDSSFHCVVTIQGFEYFHRYKLFLDECNRVLGRDGLLIFDFLNRHSYKWTLKQKIGRTLEPPSANLSYEEVFDALVNAGFEIEGFQGYGWPPFHRESNSVLVDTVAMVEDALHLGRFHTVSPKIIVAARKGR